MAKLASCSEPANKNEPTHSIAIENRRQERRTYSIIPNAVAYLRSNDAGSI
jgi:hypothetical protein